MSALGSHEDGEGFETFSDAPYQTSSDGHMPYSLNALDRAFVRHVLRELQKSSSSEFGQQMNRSVTTHHAGDAILEGEPVLHFGFVTLGPLVLVCRSID
jgi:hypothetical protein